jgi:hypothetical protein
LGSIVTQTILGKDTSEDGGTCYQNACDYPTASTPTNTPGPIQGPALPPTSTPPSVECSPGNPC